MGLSLESSLLVLVSPQAFVNKVNLYAPLLIDVILVPAVVNKNDFYANFLSMHVLTTTLTLRILQLFCFPSSVQKIELL